MKNNFKENLKQLRTENKLGQIELAKSLNVSKGIISLWENGLREPSMSNLIEISQYFKITIDELIEVEK